MEMANFSHKIRAVSVAPMVYWMGTRCTIFVAQSTIMRMPSFFCSLLGNPMIKSIEIYLPIFARAALAVEAVQRGHGV